MPQYLLLMHAPVGQDADLSPDEAQKIIERYSAWAGKLTEEKKLLGAQKLNHEAGTIVDAKGTVRNGPFSETKEVIGGYFIVEAADEAEAVEIAKAGPHCQRGFNTEIRKLD